MNIQYDRLYFGILSLTLGILILALTWPGSIQHLELGFFIFLMALTGIPHGATDHLVYAFVEKEKGREISYAYFLGIYLFAILLYGIFWYIFPLASLIVFLGISIYHFGQSQLLYLKTSEKHGLKILLYLLYGSAVLSGIILFHWQQSFEILATLIDVRWLPQTGQFAAQYYLPWILGGASVLGLTWAWHKGWLTQTQWGFELVNLAVLLWVANFTTLLVSFAVYFGLWHAPASILAEIQSMKVPGESFTLGRFFRKAFPFSLISFAGIFVLIFSARWWGHLVSPYLLFFIAISTLTLPHMFFMDKLYRQTS